MQGNVQYIIEVNGLVVSTYKVMFFAAHRLQNSQFS